VHADDVELGGRGGLLVASGELQRCIEDMREDALVGVEQRRCGLLSRTSGTAMERGKEQPW
jgi:hypothetical protein